MGLIHFKEEKQYASYKNTEILYSGTPDMWNDKERDIKYDRVIKLEKWPELTR